MDPRHMFTWGVFAQIAGESPFCQSIGVGKFLSADGAGIFTGDCLHSRCSVRWKFLQSRWCLFRLNKLASMNTWMFSPNVFPCSELNYVGVWSQTRSWVADSLEVASFHEVNLLDVFIWSLKQHPELSDLFLEAWSLHEVGCETISGQRSSSG